MRAPRLTVVLLGIALAAGPVAANAAPLDTTGASQCRTRGFSTDRDPKGTNVRSAPRADAPIIGHLAPLTRISPDTVTGVEFEIVGSRDGWLLIQKGDGAVVLDLFGPNWGPDSVHVSAIHACRDKYVEVTATPPGGKPVRGWSWSPCASQLTTCDSAGSAEPE